MGVPPTMPLVDPPQVDFGARMKRAREEKGVSLRQIADRTKLSVGALDALERNDISRLPGGIFSRAFVRSYALEIGLDPEQTVREFLQHFPNDSVSLGRSHASVDDGAPGGDRRGRLGVVVVIVVTLVIAGILVLVRT
jgi:cytoskeletal protein RodZ